MCAALYDDLNVPFIMSSDIKREMKNFLSLFKKFSLLSLFILFLVWIFIFNWSFVFKKKIVGEVVAAERVMDNVAIISQSQKAFNPQVFSFSVGIKDQNSGEIFMASSEDRKWAAVSKGNCVVAAFFPYPPWRTFDKGTTDHNARLLRNYTSCSQMPVEDGFFDWIKFFFLAY